MNEFQTQCWICPYCYDDHREDYECHAAKQQKTLASENSLLRSALTEIWEGGLPQGVYGSVIERYLTCMEIARIALESSKTPDKAPATSSGSEDQKT